MTNVSVPYVPLNNRLTSVFSDLLNVSEMGAITQRLVGNNFQLCIETDDSLDQLITYLIGMLQDLFLV